MTVALHFYLASSEAAIDWFGKPGINWHIAVTPGINWHIAVTVYKKGEQIETVTHVHLQSAEKTNILNSPT